MAEFCKACSIDVWGKDYGDFEGLRTPEMVANGTFPVVICEGCGAIQVDTDGSCVSPDCLLDGEYGHGPNGWEWGTDENKS